MNLGGGRSRRGKRGKRDERAFEDELRRRFAQSESPEQMMEKVKRDADAQAAEGGRKPRARTGGDRGEGSRQGLGWQAEAAGRRPRRGMSHVV